MCGVIPTTPRKIPALRITPKASDVMKERRETHLLFVLTFHRSDGRIEKAFRDDLRKKGSTIED
jgi:hypothetical protein